MRDPLLTEILSRRGASKRIAEACGISKAAVSKWPSVPLGRVQQVADALGVPVACVREVSPVGGPGSAPSAFAVRSDRANGST